MPPSVFAYDLVHRHLFANPMRVVAYGDSTGRFKITGPKWPPADAGELLCFDGKVTNRAQIQFAPLPWKRAEIAAVGYVDHRDRPIFLFPYPKAVVLTKGHCLTFDPQKLEILPEASWT